MMRKRPNIVWLMLFSVLVFAGCTKSDRNDEAVALSKEIVRDGLSDVEHSVERVDSAEQAGLFTAVRANTTKAIIYENADRRRLAAYFAEKAIAAEAGHAVTTSADSNFTQLVSASNKRKTHKLKTFFIFLCSLRKSV